MPRQALTKYAIYNVAKQAGKWLSIPITKGSFARFISKAIPVIGGIISASVSAGDDDGDCRAAQISLAHSCIRKC